MLLCFLDLCNPRYICGTISFTASAVGGFFRSNLQKLTFGNFTNPTNGKLVDGSDPTVVHKKGHETELAVECARPFCFVGGI